MTRASVADAVSVVPSLSVFDLLTFAAIAGPFLSIPVLLRALPSGPPAVERVRRRYGIGSVATTVGAVGVGIGVWIPFVVREALPNEYVYGAGASLFVGGVVLSTYAACNLPTYVRARTTPTTDVVSAKPGLVELTGRIRPLETIVAPLSGDRAVCYRLVVEEWLYDRGPDVVHVATERRPFFLDDGTGRVLVEPGGADLRFRSDSRTETDPDEGSPESASRVLRSEPELEHTENRRRYAESKLVPDEEVYVLGRAKRDPEAAGSLSIDDGGREFVIKPGDAGSVTAAFRRIVVRGGLAGIALASLGQAIMLGILP